MAIARYMKIVEAIVLQNYLNKEFYLKINEQKYRELADGYTLKAAEQGVTGSRQFIYDGETYTNSIGTFTANIPEIGDSIFTTKPSGMKDFPKVVCRSITKKYVGNDVRKWVLTCDYSSEPFDVNSFYKADNLVKPSKITDRPMSMEFGGDYQILQPVLEKDVALDWSWTYSDGSRVNEPIPFRVVTAKIKINKIVPDKGGYIGGGQSKGYNDFLTIVLSNLGRINGNLKLPEKAGDKIENIDPLGKSKNLFENYPGCWLFSEYNTTSYYNYEDVKMWKCELTFEFRTPSVGTTSGSIFKGYPTYGWLRILRNNATFDLPYFFKDTKKCFIYPQNQDIGFAKLLNY